MPANYQLGRLAQIRINGQLWNAVKEVTIELNSVEADITARGDAGWRVYAQALREIQITITALSRSDDPILQTILNVWNSEPPGNLLTVTISEAPFNYEGKFHVSSIRESQPIDDAETVEIVLKPSLLRVTA